MRNRPQMPRFAPRLGFTLIEVLLVITIIAILAAVAFTRIFISRQRATEAQARGTLRELRRAVKMFESDMGVYPASLADVCRKNPPDQGLVAAGSSVRTVTFSPAQKLDYKGPYCDYPAYVLPINKITGGSEEGTDWVYVTDDVATLGVVRNGAPGRDSNGVPYSEW